MEAVLHGAEHAFQDQLSGVLERVESHAFHTPEMQMLQEQLCRADHGFQAIARLRTLIDLINSRHNVLVRIIDAPLMYSVQVAFGAERWRRRTAAQVGKSIASWAKLRRYSRWRATLEHPADPFPEFLEGRRRSFE